MSLAKRSIRCPILTTQFICNISHSLPIYFELLLWIFVVFFYFLFMSNLKTEDCLWIAIIGYWPLLTIENVMKWCFVIDFDLPSDPFSISPLSVLGICLDLNCESSSNLSLFFLYYPSSRWNSKFDRSMPEAILFLL